MPRRDFLFLLLPSAFLLFIAGLALACPTGFSFPPRIEQRRQQSFEKFIAQIQSGEVHLTKDQWIKLLRDARDVEQVAQEGYASLTRIVACGILRVRTGSKQLWQSAS
jgi:hypothetical protein